ncbi:hypothetical protein RvY_03083 [Ramazzottius varieornatus]|uniref:Uncharacterized protein n=1 Tax=Ramazzottius varieornatus TaxID=947166 RepID=A0A1D1ULW9_RAMVA|nr:hypothetical protein RvY_03083 [Ramazzottius varieornatus]
MFTAELPSNAAERGRDLINQATHSHGLIWGSRGFRAPHDVPNSCSALFDGYLIARPANIYFYVRGLQKYRPSENCIPAGKNLEDLGCPRFGQLADKENTTRTRHTSVGIATRSEVRNIVATCTLGCHLNLEHVEAQVPNSTLRSSFLDCCFVSYPTQSPLSTASVTADETKALTKKIGAK